MERVKKIAKNKYAIILAISLAIVVLFVLFFKPNPVLRINWNKVKAVKGNSALILEAPTEVDGVGKTFTLKVNMDTKGYIVNAVQSNLIFDPKVVEVSKISTEKSFCKFYPENKYSNSKGTITLSCGSPYPGFNGKNTVIEVEFLAKAIKTTEIKISNDSMVLANDGKGTNLLNEFDSASIKIKAAL